MKARSCVGSTSTTTRRIVTVARNDQTRSPWIVGRYMNVRSCGDHPPAPDESEVSSLLTSDSCSRIVTPLASRAPTVS